MCSVDIPSQLNIFEYGYYSHSYALLQFRLKLEHCKPKAHLIIINEVQLFLTVYHIIIFLTLSNQTSHHKMKCIRIIFDSRPSAQQGI